MCMRREEEGARERGLRESHVGTCICGVSCLMFIEREEVREEGESHKYVRCVCVLMCLICIGGGERHMEGGRV